MSTEAHIVERYVRGKNQVYRRWRKGKQYRTLDAWCAECLFRFGTLPHWIERADARRAHDYAQAEHYDKTQRAWKAEIREWCLKAGVTEFANQSAQFYKYYSAWYRAKWEKEHGKSNRGYALQMY